MLGNQDRDNNPDWILSQKLLLKYLYSRIKQVVEAEQVVGEEVEEFHDREDNLENNWILSERFFLKLLFPFITQFMEEDLEDFCTWGHWVWKQGELLKDCRSLKMEEQEVSSLSKHLDYSFARFIENARTTKTRKQFMRLRKSFANN
uniref:Uncharacterized protein n=1 Tax=Cyphia tortilis TaxID=2041122 RepID=A0A291F589_9ASTR|nr:hypothetical protein Cyp_tor1Pt0250 [Cyphia tortilis]ATG27297.1 hypothetical protein Cyp_tor1Pt0250 [Cyphia tortilis]